MSYTVTRVHVRNGRCWCQTLEGYRLTSQPVTSNVLRLSYRSHFLTDHAGKMSSAEATYVDIFPLDSAATGCQS